MQEIANRTEAVESSSNFAIAAAVSVYCARALSAGIVMGFTKFTRSGAHDVIATT